MSNVTWLNRKTGLTTSAAVLTQRQTQLVHTINNNIVIMRILGILNYLTVKTMYLSKLVKYQMRENPNSDFYYVPQCEMSGDPCKITQNTGLIPGSGNSIFSSLMVSKDHHDLCL